MQLPRPSTLRVLVIVNMVSSCCGQRLDSLGDIVDISVGVAQPENFQGESGGDEAAEKDEVVGVHCHRDCMYFINSRYQLQVGKFTS